MYVLALPPYKVNSLAWIRVQTPGGASEHVLFVVFAKKGKRDLVGVLHAPRALPPRIDRVRLLRCCFPELEGTDTELLNWYYRSNCQIEGRSGLPRFAG